VVFRLGLQATLIAERKEANLSTTPVTHAPFKQVSIAAAKVREVFGLTTSGLGVDQFQFKITAHELFYPLVMQVDSLDSTGQLVKFSLFSIPSLPTTDQTGTSTGPEIDSLLQELSAE